MIEVGVLFQQAAAALRRERHATYRLQLGSAHGFDAVASLGPYLDALGVSDAYLSPCFQRGPGSTHGYDVTDHNAFNPEIGGAAALRPHGRRAGRARPRPHPRRRAQSHGHRRATPTPGGSTSWRTARLAPRRLLRHRLDSRSSPSCANKVLLPVLPDQYGRVLEAQQLQLELDGRRLPPPLRRRARCRIAPRHLRRRSSTERLDVLAGASARKTRGLLELRSILTALEPPARRGPRPIRRASPSGSARRRSSSAGSPPSSKESAGDPRAHRRDRARASTATPGEPGELRRCSTACSSAQAYRLADWRVAGDEVNYRRFFDINDLAAIRMERAATCSRRPTSSCCGWWARAR